jgi:hypothetical protein
MFVSKNIVQTSMRDFYVNQSLAGQTIYNTLNRALVVNFIKCLEIVLTEHTSVENNLWPNKSRFPLCVRKASRPFSYFHISFRYKTSF